MKLRNVHFVGAVPPDRIAGCYASADVYVQTPAVDNMPLSILEAFASGLPVVSTCVGGVPAIVTDREDGLLAPDNDAEAVAARILELLHQPDLARRLAATAAGKCEHYDWRSTRDSWLAVYRALARSNRSVHPLEAQEPA
jgi:glycosyltransferase involved in cell wall biosynthesis